MGGGLVEVSGAGDEVTVYPPTELDLTTAPLLDMLLSQASALEAPRVVVDLRDVAFIDGRCVGMLQDAAGAARNSGRSLVVRHPTRHFLRIVWALNDASVLDLLGGHEE
jgi:anti-anti-sigma factor